MPKSKKIVHPEMIYSYFKKVVLSNANLSYEQTKEIFLMGLKDYFNKIIEAEKLATLATELYYELNKPSDFFQNPQLNELGKALEAASEIDYYYKNKEKHKTTGKMYNKYENSLKKYYEKNKNSLKQL